MRSGLQCLLFASVLVLAGCRASLPPEAAAPVPIRRGVVTAPDSLAAVSRAYFHTLDHSLLFLTLGEDGTYFAEQDGMSDGSVSRGQWQLQGSRITLGVPEQSGMTAMWLRDCADLDVLWSERGWVLLPCGVRYRKSFKEHGISGEACFIQRRIQRQ
jgi:hypothetical protein